MANHFRFASIWLKIALVCMALGFLLFIIGFSTNSWKTYSRNSRGGTTDRGLWQATECDYNGNCRTHTYGNPNDFQRAIQAMECLGLIGFFLALLLMALYMCADSARRRDVLQADTLFTFAGTLFAGIGFALAASSHKNNHILGYNEMGWSMGVALAGTIFYGIAGVMLILQLIGC